MMKVITHNTKKITMNSITMFTCITGILYTYVLILRLWKKRLVRSLDSIHKLQYKILYLVWVQHVLVGNNAYGALDFKFTRQIAFLQKFFIVPQVGWEMVTI